MRKVFLEELSIYKNGKICWKNSIGSIVRFIYDDIEGYIEILDYVRGKNSKVLLKYNNKEVLMCTSHFRKCKLGNLLNVNTTDFKIEIGTTFKDDKRDITIIDRKYEKRRHGKAIVNEKLYKYRCNKCGYECGEHIDVTTRKYLNEYWVPESDLIGKKQIGCSCCNGTPQSIVYGINDITTTSSWMIPIINDIDFCKTHTRSTTKEKYLYCPFCGRKSNKKISINALDRGTNFCICYNGKSYPEKVMYKLLEKCLNGNFISEYNKKDSNWCKNYRYDFYFKLNGEEYIVETHGMQHYKGGFESCGGKTLEEEQLNDRNKKELAIKNGIKPENYIVIDCRYSNLEFIKNNIINSRLNELFNLHSIYQFEL